MTVFAFRQPRWQAPEPVLFEAIVLLLASGIWLFVYGWLAQRLWTFGLQFGRLNIFLTLMSIVLGVGVALGWRHLYQHWQLPTFGRRWRGLSKERMMELTPVEFEEYVAQHIFARQGYRVHDTPHVKDGGIDVLMEDENGKRAIVQCKRYRGTVGAKTIRALYGTMIHEGASLGYLVTTGRISNDARKWAQGKPIKLIDGDMLERLANSKPLVPNSR